MVFAGPRCIIFALKQAILVLLLLGKITKREILPGKKRLPGRKCRLTAQKPRFDVQLPLLDPCNYYR